MMIADVHGQFNGVRGVVRFDPATPAHLSVEAEIDVAGIYTGIGKRDEHLRSPDFFDAPRYPAITFTGKRTDGGGGRECAVTGELTIRGVTRTVTLEGEYTGPLADPFDEGAMSVGFTGTTVINREDYGVIWNATWDGGIMVGREVRITLNVEADRGRGESGPWV